MRSSEPLAVRRRRITAEPRVAAEQRTLGKRVHHVLTPKVLHKILHEIPGFGALISWSIMACELVRQTLSGYVLSCLATQGGAVLLRRPADPGLRC